MIRILFIFLPTFSESFGPHNPAAFTCTFLTASRFPDLDVLPGRAVNQQNLQSWMGSTFVPQSQPGLQNRGPNENLRVRDSESARMGQSILPAFWTTLRLLFESRLVISWSMHNCHGPTLERWKRAHLWADKYSTERPPSLVLVPLSACRLDLWPLWQQILRHAMSLRPSVSIMVRAVLIELSWFDRAIMVVKWQRSTPPSDAGDTLPPHLEGCVMVYTTLYWYIP